MSRKQHSARLPRATKSGKPRVKSVKVTVKVEPADDVTCSTDDVRSQSTAARHDVDARRCNSGTGDGLLPDTTTTDSVGDDIAEAVTSLSGRCLSAASSGGVVSDEMTAEIRHSSAATQLVHGVPGPATSRIISPYQHPYHYAASVQYAAPLQQQYYRYDDTRAPSVSAAAGRLVDDIDDILSVMARVAGSPPRASNYQ